MRKLAILLLLIFATATLRAGVVEKADSAYAEKNYVEAIRLYGLAADSLGTSSDLYYNIGNAYYRLQKPGKAILNYERSLRLDPSNADARANLDFINSKLPDRPGQRGTFVGNAFDAAADFLGTNGWATAALVCFVLVVGAGLLYFFASNIALRKLGFFGGGCLLLVTVISLFFSFRGASSQDSDDEAIITESSTILSTSPRQPANASEEAMLLHEGTKLTILDSVTVTTDSVKTTWLDVEVDNEHRAWVNARAVERI